MPKWHSAASRSARATPSRAGTLCSPACAVELDVLAGVDDVEAGDPQQHGPAQHDRRQQIEPDRASTCWPRMAIQAETGASISAAPSQKWAAAVNRFVKL